MNQQNPTNLTVEQAEKILKEYSCTDIKPVESESEKVFLRQALKVITDLADYVNFGICAESTEEGFQALQKYLNGLGYNVSLDTQKTPEIPGSVYIKFNTNKQSYYLDSYTGNYRGVLVSCQSSAREDISGTYGHLPLDLFD
ncbi:DUF1824 family protein [Aerosakkonemataceae cyanobacterium BLCC-F154]|uniref:DUF1824 family protein n=1 Tax=Floridaenema fluviatile BLCC-F154 TaxID=3153640 RepID=A0ABV4Y8G0_9CYAN